MALTRSAIIGSNMQDENNAKARPYWHLDAKWIFGLALAAVLAPAFLFYNLVKITEEKSAVDAMAMGLALSFSRNGLDDKTEIVLLARQAATNPDKNIQPISGLKIYIKGSDILNLSPREARLKLFRQLALPIYKNGSEGLSSLAESATMKKNIEGGVGFLALVSESSHNTLKKIFFILTVISLALFLPFIFFSYRFGRLINAGLVVLVTSLPFGLLSNAANLILKSQTPPATPPPGEAGISGMAGYLAGNILPGIVKIAAGNYLFIILLGLVIVAVGILLALVWKIVRRNRAWACC